MSVQLLDAQGPDVSRDPLERMGNPGGAELLLEVPLIAAELEQQFTGWLIFRSLSISP